MATDATVTPDTFKQLEEKQAQLLFAINASGLGTWVLDPVQRIIHWDDRCREFFGFVTGDHVAYDDVLKHMHPDDQGQVDQAVQWALNPKSGGHYEVEFRTVNADDGRIRWLRCKGKADFDNAGVAYRFAGSAQDITDQVIAHQHIERAEQLAQLAVDGAGAGTFFIDPTDNSMVYSPTLSRIFTGEERTDLTRDLLLFNYVHPEDLPVREQAYKEAAKTGKLKYEARTIWDDGSVHWLRISGAYQFDITGKAIRFSGIAQDITPEVEARQEQQQLASLVEGSPEYMAVATLDGRMRYVNGFGLNLVGLSRDEVTEKRMIDFHTPQDWQLFERETLPAVLTNRQWEGVRFYRHFRTGEQIPLDIKGFLLDDPASGQPYALVTTGRDLRPERASRQALIESESALQKINQRLQMALSAGRLGSYELELATGLMQCTSQCKANYGFPPEATFNYPDLIQVIVPDDRERMQSAVANALANHTVYNIEYRINWPDHSLHWIRASGQGMYDEHGQSHKMVGITLDITTERMAQQELERQVNERTNELSNANRELVRTNYELEQFAYIASHDLQEPLRKIQSFASLLQENQQTEELANVYLDKIIKSASRMSALIKAVLSYSRLARTDELFEATDLSQVLQNVLTDFELLIEQKGATIRYDPLPVIQAIPLQMNQLLTNLISNALTFTETSPVVEIRARLLSGQAIRAQPTLNQSLRYVHLTVSDNGIGFEQQYADRIFTIFQRLSNGRQYSGTGIGLALCRKIVDNHSGLISAESVPKQGTTFHIYLPAARHPLVSNQNRSQK